LRESNRGFTCFQRWQEILEHFVFDSFVRAYRLEKLD